MQGDGFEFMYGGGDVGRGWGKGVIVVERRIGWWRWWWREVCCWEETGGGRESEGDLILIDHDKNVFFI